MCYVDKGNRAFPRFVCHKFQVTIYGWNGRCVPTLYGCPVSKFLYQAHTCLCLFLRDFIHCPELLYLLTFPSSILCHLHLPSHPSLVMQAMSVLVTLATLNIALAAGLPSIIQENSLVARDLPWTDFGTKICVDVNYSGYCESFSNATTGLEWYSCSTLKSIFYTCL